MSIFREVKEHISARSVAEGYGLKVRRNGMACCPFHEDKHPSMKIDQMFYCFGCGAKGDSISYVANMFGLSQYDAACKIIKDFQLNIQTRSLGNKKKEIHSQQNERMRIIQIKKKFDKWCNETGIQIKELKEYIIAIKQHLRQKSVDEVMNSDAVASLFHAEVLLEYWLDILCMGTIEEKQEFFKKGRKEVDSIVNQIKRSGAELLGADWRNNGNGDEQRRGCA